MAGVSFFGHTLHLSDLEFGWLQSQMMPAGTVIWWTQWAKLRLDRAWLRSIPAIKRIFAVISLPHGPFFNPRVAKKWSSHVSKNACHGFTMMHPIQGPFKQRENHDQAGGILGRNRFFQICTLNPTPELLAETIPSSRSRSSSGESCFGFSVISLPVASSVKTSKKTCPKLCVKKKIYHTAYHTAYVLHRSHVSKIIWP